MFTFRISNPFAGINLDESKITLNLRFPGNHSRILLHRPRDIIQAYSLFKNDRLVYSLEDARLENDVAPFIDQEYQDLTDVVVITGIEATLEIALSDLYLFTSMEYNIPNTCDVLELQITLANDFIVDGKPTKLEYQVRSVDFKQSLMPPLDDDDVRKVPFDKLTLFTKHNPNGEFHCKIFGRNLCGAMVISDATELELQSEDAFTLQTAPSIYAILPATNEKEINLDVICDRDSISILTCKEKVLKLRA